jgi:hypothetical protein
MELTLTVPDELATRLRAVEDRLPEIIDMGLRERLSASPGYTASPTYSRHWLGCHRRRKSSA